MQVGVALQRIDHSNVGDCSFFFMAGAGLKREAVDVRQIELGMSLTCGAAWQRLFLIGAIKLSIETGIGCGVWT